ncbi:hypothetical protein NDU88_003368 [Pleurodeles waltl]|uniref:Uncharacterized protein n=1 Tax=Pleurodeles waltl TaxID=8319 RepID=A0AAV7REX5_PLEWA|nr:hypothetical protein NDU88_003368 [Pleurodeles waltl]
MDVRMFPQQRSLTKQRQLRLQLTQKVTHAGVHRREQVCAAAQSRSPAERSAHPSPGPARLRSLYFVSASLSFRLERCPPLGFGSQSGNYRDKFD